MTAAIRFPVLPIPADGALRTVSTREQLETCNDRALRNGHYDAMFIIDSDGFSYVVVEANRGQHTQSWRPFRGRLLRVHLELRPQGRLSLQEAQNRVCETIESHPHLWESIADLAKFTAIVRQAETMDELLRI